MANPKVKRRWLRYSLLTLLAIVAVTAGAYAWLSAKAAREQKAAAAIEKLHGFVGWTPPAAPVWLRCFVGNELFQHVDIVDLEGLAVRDDQLKVLEDLDSLVSLNLGNTGISDAAVTHLKGLSRLRELDISANQITDAALENLNGMDQLMRVNVWGTHVTENGFRRIAELTHRQAATSAAGR
jgi:hypothetical protein